eukprot:4127622-Prymnesium_polylepis.3
MLQRLRAGLRGDPSARGPRYSHLRRGGPRNCCDDGAQASGRSIQFQPKRPRQVDIVQRLRSSEQWSDIMWCVVCQTAADFSHEKYAIWVQLGERNEIRDIAADLRDAQRPPPGRAWRPTDVLSLLHPFHAGPLHLSRTQKLRRRQEPRLSLWCVSFCTAPHAVSISGRVS